MADTTTGIRIFNLPLYNGSEANKIDTDDYDNNYLVIDDSTSTDGTRRVSLGTLVNSLEKSSVVISNIDWAQVDNKPSWANNASLGTDIDTLKEDVQNMNSRIPTKSENDNTVDNTYVSPTYVANYMAELIGDNETSQTKLWSSQKISEELAASGKIQSVSAGTNDTGVKVETNGTAVTVLHKAASALRLTPTGTLVKGDNATTNTASFNVPKVEVNNTGHVVGLSEATITVPVPELATDTTAGTVKAAALEKIAGHDECKINNGKLYAPGAIVLASKSTSDGSPLSWTDGAITEDTFFEIYTKTSDNTVVPLNITSIVATTGKVTITYEAPEKTLSVRLIGHNY